MANAQVNVQFIPNSRGGRHLVYLGHKFRVKSTKRNRVHWKCCKTGCPATANTVDDVLSSCRNIHNHHQDEVQVQIDTFLAVVKTKVRNDSRPVQDIYDEELHKLRADVPEVVPAVPTFYGAHSNLYRARAKEMPKLPRQRDDINLPDVLTKTATNDDFLLHATPNNKIMIFATTDNLRHLAAADVYYCDGTFSMCPGLFFQIYSIHAFVEGKMFPLVYGLLPDKKQSTYVDFFRLLKQKAAESNIDLRPVTFFSDFEKGAQNAAKEVFECETKGCMFHYRQALVKHGKKYGLQCAYKDNDNVRTFVRRALALPLVRVCDVEDFWLHALENVDQTDQGVQRFADYVTEQREESCCSGTISRQKDQELPITSRVGTHT